MGSSKKIAENKPLLNPKWEEFCQLYVSGDKEFYGNGTQSYIEAFDVDLNKKNAYNTVRVKASQLLTKGNIIKRINELLDAQGFNDENVKKQHTFLLNQFAELPVKAKAIAEYYKVKGSYAPEKKEFSGEVSLKGLAEALEYADES